MLCLALEDHILSVDTLDMRQNEYDTEILYLYNKKFLAKRSIACGEKYESYECWGFHEGDVSSRGLLGCNSV